MPRTNAGDAGDVNGDEEMSIFVELETGRAGVLVKQLVHESLAAFCTTFDHCLSKQPTVRLDQLDGVPMVHFAPENGLVSWLDYSLAEAGVRPDPVMRTAVTASAPQLAATGLGVAITPISAVGEGFPGAVRSFSPRWFRQLVAITPAAPDPLAARFIGELRARGVLVPKGIRQQLATDPTAGDDLLRPDGV